MEKDLERVAKLWDKTATDRASDPVQGWLDSPIVLEKYVQPRITGSPSQNWLVGLTRRVGVPRGGRWLSLGCGAANQEILAATQGLFASLLALDASPVSLQRGREMAAAQGITSIEFREVDFNRLNLPPETYDVVLMGMSLHHVLELGYVLSQVRRTLKRDGFFLINEFIGPRQFQFTDLQLGFVRELLDVLPPSLRRDSATGEIKTEYVRLPVDHWNIADPSEAIRSDVIVKEIEKRFRVVARIDYGGTILNLLLEHIVHNFDRANEKDVSILRLLAKTEDLLIRCGDLTSDFTVMAMKRSRFPATLVQQLRSVLAEKLKGRPHASSRPSAPASTDASEVDFRREAHSCEVVSGLYQWEGFFRWMGPRAELALLMTSRRMNFLFAAPLAALQRGHPDWKSMDVRVRLGETESGSFVDLDVISIADDRPDRFVREVPEAFFSIARGRQVRLILECDRAWVPAESLPGSTDVRSLTVQILQAGFEDGF